VILSSDVTVPSVSKNGISVQTNGGGNRNGGLEIQNSKFKNPRAIGLHALRQSGMFCRGLIQNSIFNLSDALFLVFYFQDQPCL